MWRARPSSSPWIPWRRVRPEGESFHQEKEQEKTGGVPGKEVTPVTETWTPVLDKQPVIALTAKHAPVSDPSKDIDQDVQSFYCIQCDISFKKKNALTVHVGWEHKEIVQLDGANSSMSENCEKCDEIFANSNSLQQHMLMRFSYSQPY